MVEVVWESGCIQHPSLAAYAHKRGGGGYIGVSLATCWFGGGGLGLISQPAGLMMCRFEVCWLNAGLRLLV